MKLMPAQYSSLYKKVEGLILYLINFLGEAKFHYYTAKGSSGQ
jgi:hypothetical protein